MSAPDAYNAAQKYIRATSLEIKETTGNEKIIAGGERQYDTTILIIMLLLVGIFALIYYFTRKKNTLTVNIASRDQGSAVSIVAEGPKAEAVMQFLSEILRQLKASESSTLKYPSRLGRSRKQVRWRLYLFDSVVVVWEPYDFEDIWDRIMMQMTKMKN